jgi:acetolactate synthase-1/2/3 large subunit
VALAAPVVLTSEGKGAVAADLPGTVPPAAVFPLLEEADAVVVVGSRFHLGASPVRRDPPPTLVRIDLDETQLERHAAAGGDEISVLADAGDGAAALAQAVAGLRPADTERDALHRARVDEIRTALLRGLAEHFPDTWSYCRALRAAIPSDGILVDEMTQVGYMARNAYPAAEGRTYIGSGYQGTLGFGFATALGAKVGRPDTVVVSISGDGGFLYTAAELATAVHHHIAVVAVVFVDDAYGNVKGIQQRVYGREIASTLTNPDLVRLAESFGVHGARVEGPEELSTAIAAAVERDHPAVIAVPIGPQPDILAVLTGRRRL